MLFLIPKLWVSSSFVNRTCVLVVPLKFGILFRPLLFGLILPVKYWVFDMPMKLGLVLALKFGVHFLLEKLGFGHAAYVYLTL